MKPLLVPIRRLPNSAGLAFPSYQSEGAAGMDLQAAVESEVRIAAGQIVVVPTGFSIALPEGFEAQIRPRSGLATKHGITVINSPGTIDADYRGELLVALINLGTVGFEISRGLRIAQLILAPISRTQWLETECHPPTNRGDGGFGHTGN